MKKSPNRVHRFFLRNQQKGIPNLMLWIAIINAVVYVLNVMDPSKALYGLLSFNRSKILSGQIWRLFSYVFLELSGRSLIWGVIWFVFYYQLGRSLENIWGRCKFNCYYLTGVLFLSLGGLVLNIPVSSFSFHVTLFLAYATLYPEATFLIFFIIPIKSRWLAIITLGLNVIQLLYFSLFPQNLLPLFGMLNYFLYFGKDFLNIFPASWRLNGRRLIKKAHGPRKKTVPFPSSGSQEFARNTTGKAYTHKCRVCGRTDQSNPNLEFRYCSRCSGYQCYCIDHINDHIHVDQSTED